MDWQEWHAPYDDPDSRLSRRLAEVQGCLRTAIDATPPGDFRLISMCSGEARDVLGVLDGHPRRAEAHGLLVEWDPTLAQVARDRAEQIGATNLEVRTGDAAELANYSEAAPADIVLVCGVFGNISDEDIERTVLALPQLCGAGGTVIWTRHTHEPDITPKVREWFTDAGFEEISWSSPEEWQYGVGANRFVGHPEPLDLGGRIFTFIR